MHAASSALDQLHRAVELLAAVAARRAEDVARQALRVDAHEDRLVGLRIPHDERDVRAVFELGVKRVDRPRAAVGRKQRRGDARHQPLGAHAVADQVGDREQLQPVRRARTGGAPGAAPSFRRRS